MIVNLHIPRTFDSFGTIASARKTLMSQVDTKVGILTLLKDPKALINKALTGKV